MCKYMCVCDKQHTHKYTHTFSTLQKGKNILQKEYWEGGILCIGGSDSEFEHNISAICKCSALCTPISTAIIIIVSTHTCM